MTTYANPAAERSMANNDRVGDLVVNPFAFDVANAAYKPASLAISDKVQIGIVPAGCVLLPHLSLIRIPALDTNGSPTGSASIGTSASAANIKATTSVSAAQTLSGEDFLLTNGPIGSRTVDTPIYLTFTAAVATLQTTGTIYADLAIRCWDKTIDG
jgi:hypothetical protein